MPTRKKKLIKVMDGLYRSEDGNVRIACQLPWRGKPKHWVATWTNWFGCKVTKEFSLLREAREWYDRLQRGDPQ
jgi:ABC-type uncharacterized transport system ATPase subunit